MARKRGRKPVKQVASSAGNDFNHADEKEPQIEKQEAQFTDLDVDRQISAIRAMRDVEIEHLLTKLRLLRSYFTKEQLQTPLLHFFKHNYQNLSVVTNGENGMMEVQWLEKDGNVSMNDGIDLHETFFRRLSMAYSGCSAPIPSLGSFEFSSKAVRTSILGADNLQIRDFGPYNSLMLGKQDTLQTPGVSSQRLSIGMTPKTVRFPKPGEMLVSVHGSPLGVYKEDNMVAIHESEEGWLASNCSSSESLFKTLHYLCVLTITTVIPCERVSLWSLIKGVD